MLTFFCSCLRNCWLTPAENIRISPSRNEDEKLDESVRIGSKIRKSELASNNYNRALLVVDDSLSIIKSLRHKIIQELCVDEKDSRARKPSPIPEMECQLWAKQGIAWEFIDATAIIYAGNGQIMLDIMQYLQKEITIVLLTDQSMPYMEGTELINSAMDMENPPIAIALHTTDTIENNKQISDIFLQRKNIDLITKNDYLAITHFIQSYCTQQSNDLTTHHSDRGLASSYSNLCVL